MFKALQHANATAFSAFVDSACDIGKPPANIWVTESLQRTGDRGIERHWRQEACSITEPS
jgi:hypothetical protein